jgi:hypothetical protein
VGLGAGDAAAVKQASCHERCSHAATHLTCALCKIPAFSNEHNINYMLLVICSTDRDGGA